MPERHPGFGGEIDLGVPTQASCSFAVAAPGRGGAQTRLCLLDGNCRRGALSALTSLFAASVERETLQHLDPHGRDVSAGPNCAERRSSGGDGVRFWL